MTRFSHSAISFGFGFGPSANHDEESRSSDDEKRGKAEQQNDGDARLFCFSFAGERNWRHGRQRSQPRDSSMSPSRHNLRIEIRPHLRVCRGALSRGSGPGPRASGREERLGLGAQAPWRPGPHQVLVRSPALVAAALPFCWPSRRVTRVSLESLKMPSHAESRVALN